MPDGQVPQNNVLALMFDMNKLWEEYIYVVLKRKLSNKVVRAQEGKQFWERKTNAGERMEQSIKTAVHSGMVTPVVSCPTERVIVFSLFLIASRTAVIAFWFSSSSSPLPTARTTVYSLNTGCCVNSFFKATAESTRSLLFWSQESILRGI